MYYPLLLQLNTVHVAIIGAGKVGQRKLRSIIPYSPASITVYDLYISEEKLKELKRNISEVCKEDSGPSHYSFDKIAFNQRRFEENDIANIGLLFAATNNAFVNDALAKLCQANHVLCNIADNEHMSNFIVPAVIRQEGVTVSVATNGYSPALTKRIKSDIENWMGNKYSKLSVIMKRVRSIVLASGYDSEENAQLFRNLVASSLEEHLNDNNYRMVIQELKAILPEALHIHIGDLLNDL